jgi:hypothetical protein
MAAGEIDSFVTSKYLLRAPDPIIIYRRNVRCTVRFTTKPGEALTGKGEFFLVLLEEPEIENI